MSAELKSIIAYEKGFKLWKWQCSCKAEFYTPYGCDFICRCGAKYDNLRYY